MPSPIPRYSKDDQITIFGPPEEPVDHKNVKSLTGNFHSKFNDKAGLMVKLIQTGEISLYNCITGQTETRELSSSLEIVVPDHIYNYPFKDGKPYTLTVHKVYPL